MDHWEIGRDFGEVRDSEALGLRGCIGNPFNLKFPSYICRLFERIL